MIGVLPEQDFQAIGKGVNLGVETWNVQGGWRKGKGSGRHDAEGEKRGKLGRERWRRRITVPGVSRAKATGKFGDPC
jgi:hypothetical protein